MREPGCRDRIGLGRSMKTDERNGVNTAGVSWVIPAYNEKASIRETATRVQRALAGTGIPHEVIVVNDGSSDGTREEAEAISGIRVLSHPVNIGYGSAIKTGILQAQYEWIGIVDADGSYAIEEIPAVLQPMQEGYDMVIAVRANIADVDLPLKRRLRQLFLLAVRLLNDSRIQDPNSGFRVFRRQMALGLMPFLCGTFSFTTSLTVLSSGLFYFIKYVPAPYSERVGSSKVRHFRDSLRTIQYLTQGVIYFNPIKYFLLLIMMMVSSVWIPVVLLSAASHWMEAAFWLAAGTSVFLLLGLAGVADIIRISSERAKAATVAGLRSETTCLPSGTARQTGPSGEAQDG